MIRDKEIDNSLHVLDILRNISKTQELEATVVFSAADILRGYLYYYRKDKQLFMKLNEIDERLYPGMKINVSFLLKETVFSFDTVIMAITENILELNPPAVFTSSFKRHYSRYSPTDDETLLVKMPDGSLHDVKDITTSGVAFYSEKLVYKIGDRIRNMQILMKNDFVRIDAMVKYIIEADAGSYFYGTEFLNNNWFSHYSLFQYIFEQTYPELQSIFNFSREEIFLLYDNSGYFDLKPRDEIGDSFNKMLKTLKKANDYPQITTNPVFVHNNKLYMGASALRIYNKTFLAQHLAAIPEARLFPGSKQSIYLGLSDYLICNPYYDYYLTYFNAHHKWHNKMYGSIAGYINDDSKYLYDTVEFFEIFFNEYIPDPPTPYRAETMADPDMFLEYSQKNIPPLIRSTFGYNKANIDLREIKQVYELIGLYLDRCIIKVEKDGVVAAYAVCESYSPGLNLFNILDSIKVYIVEKEPDLSLIFSSILGEAIYFYEKYEKMMTYLFISLDAGIKDTIDVPGVRYSHLVGRGIVDRSGIIEYKNLMLNMSR
ncbi:MAG: PilZ domain-containing protein [Clostridia bacterium]|nr:PilZ domain-containing protein [Clostridia bacterium]